MSNEDFSFIPSSLLLTLKPYLFKDSLMSRVFFLTNQLRFSFGKLFTVFLMCNNQNITKLLLKLNRGGKLSPK